MIGYSAMVVFVQVSSKGTAAHLCVHHWEGYTSKSCCSGMYTTERCTLLRTGSCIYPGSVHHVELYSTEKSTVMPHIQGLYITGRDTIMRDVQLHRGSVHLKEGNTTKSCTSSSVHYWEVYTTTKMCTSGVYTTAGSCTILRAGPSMSVYRREGYETESCTPKE